MFQRLMPCPTYLDVVLPEPLAVSSLPNHPRPRNEEQFGATNGPTTGHDGHLDDQEQEQPLFCSNLVRFFERDELLLHIGRRIWTRLYALTELLKALLFHAHTWAGLQILVQVLQKTYHETVLVGLGGNGKAAFSTPSSSASGSGPRATGNGPTSSRFFPARGQPQQPPQRSHTLAAAWFSECVSSTSSPSAGKFSSSALSRWVFTGN